MFVYTRSVSCATNKLLHWQSIDLGRRHAGSLGIPTDEIQIAADLYAGLQNFYALHTEMQNRPLFITGESYAGKYVPAIGKLQA